MRIKDDIANHLVPFLDQRLVVHTIQERKAITCFQTHKKECQCTQFSKTHPLFISKMQNGNSIVKVCKI